MNRLSRRTLSFLALATLGGAGAAVFFGAMAGGCVFGSPDPEAPKASVCSAISEYFRTCDVSSACGAAYARDCTKILPALSESEINALFTCATNGASCGDAGSAVLSTCVLAGSQNVTATAAQAQLATDYCRACAPAETGCTDDFYRAGGTAGAGLTALGIAGDTTVQTVDSACTGHLPTDAGTAACLAAFRSCATPIATASLNIPPECVSDAGLGLGSIDGG